MSINGVNDHEKVIIDFYASWCGPCKMMEPILERMENNQEIKVIKIDIEEEVNAELIKEYGIRSIPTLIAFQNGAEVGKHIGASNREQILKMFK